MKQNHVTDLLPDYLDNLLQESQKEEVEAHLKECKTCSRELEELKVLFKVFTDEKRIAPPNTIQTNFLKQLKIEKQKDPKVVTLDSEIISRKKLWAGNMLKVAASIALLIGSFMLGKLQQQQRENAEMAQLVHESMNIKQTAMLSLMGNKSASKRIQGVNYIDEFTNPDEAIVSALADRMLLDENTNVRLTAANALGNFTASETVKDAFITALKTEKDPGIQVALIHTLVKIQEKKAIVPMQQLLEQEDTQPFVKEQIKSVLPSII